MKDYLGFENARNKAHAKMYTRLMHLAFGGDQVAILIGHHLTFELAADISTENEIPSADCLLFDHDVMTRVFGSRAIDIMIELAKAPCDQRDDLLASYLESLP